MRIFNPILPAFALALVLSTSVQAQSKSTPHSHAPKPVQAAPVIDVPANTRDAVDISDRFSRVLKAGDMKGVETLLASDVLILESGGAEHSRQEYLSHHAISDAAFLKNAHSQLLRRTARRDGDTVWIGSESELHATKDGKALTLLSTETMVLRRSGDDWRIVHIHWSSRPKK
ncbi:YybH family protein [Luteimonas vadosa]|uniref:SnoaL-like domain-containing protein n=1 Tax=Luteimonas vadosa TaxID=1165507 RepID=A0ABP9E0H3_9GAMM